MDRKPNTIEAVRELHERAVYLLDLIVDALRIPQFVNWLGQRL